MSFLNFIFWQLFVPCLPGVTQALVLLLQATSREDLDLTSGVIPSLLGGVTGTQNWAIIVCLHCSICTVTCVFCSPVGQSLGGCEEDGAETSCGILIGS